MSDAKCQIKSTMKATFRESSARQRIELSEYVQLTDLSWFVDTDVYVSQTHTSHCHLELSGCNISILLSVKSQKRVSTPPPAAKADVFVYFRTRVTRYELYGCDTEMTGCNVMSPLTPLPFVFLRCWRTPQGSAGWWWPPSLQSATLPPTLRPSPPRTTCPPTWLTLTSSPTLTLSTPLSVPGSCPPTSTTSTTSPPCTAIQVRTCWLDLTLRRAI